MMMNEAMKIFAAMEKSGVLELDKETVLSLMGLMLDSWAAEHDENPIEMAKTFSEVVELVNNAVGPMDKRAGA